MVLPPSDSGPARAGKEAPPNRSSSAGKREESLLVFYPVDETVASLFHGSFKGAFSVLPSPAHASPSDKPARPRRMRGSSRANPFLSGRPRQGWPHIALNNSAQRCVKLGDA